MPTRFVPDKGKRVPRTARPIVPADMAALAGLVKAPSRGAPRRLNDFDPASLLARPRRPHP